jgi:RNA polymerase sigma factor (TIGR02999 family)
MGSSPLQDRPPYEDAASDTRRETVEDALTALYDDLRSLAARHLRVERTDHTLQPTALVHEAYLKLSRQKNLHWQNRLHFFHNAAAQIRRILVGHARARERQKRGAGLIRVTLTDIAAGAQDDYDLVDLDDALERLDAESQADRQIVELKFFGGLTEREIGKVLGISERTVRRRWLFARTWLYRELRGTSAADAGDADDDAARSEPS